MSPKLIKLLSILLPHKSSSCNSKCAHRKSSINLGQVCTQGGRVHPAGLYKALKRVFIRLRGDLAGIGISTLG